MKRRGRKHREGREQKTKGEENLKRQFDLLLCTPQSRRVNNKGMCTRGQTGGGRRENDSGEDMGGKRREHTYEL